MQLLTGNRPIPGVLFGITHTLEGAPIIREARVLKVGIGVPKGRGLNVWIHTDGLWYLQISRKGPDGRIVHESIKEGLKTRKEAEAFFREHYKRAEVVPYPRKLPYFTFTRPVLQADGTEVLEPDFDAIEAHGPVPREIDVVFLDDNPFEGAFQMWSASQLLCKGDGMIAERVVELGLKGTPDEQAAAQLAKANGERLFPVINDCWTNGCRFSKEFENRGKLQPSPCKPGGDLKFQLANNIRVGGTAYYHTSGYRSISQIFSSLERIKGLTGGRVAGIPLKMLLRPYRTRHNEQTATQYGVSVEFRAQDIQAVRKNLMEQAWKFRELAVVPHPPQETRHYLDAPENPAVSDEPEDDPPVSAQLMVDEYYPDGGGEDDDSGGPAPAPQGAEAATNAKTTALAEKLAAKKRKQPETADAEPATAPVQNAAPAPVTQASTYVEEDDHRDEPPEDPEDPRFQRKPGDVF